MSWIAAAVSVGSAVSGAIGASNASEAQQQAAAQSLALQQQMFQQQQQNVKPFLDTGGGAASQLTQYLNSGTNGLLHRFSLADLQNGLAPNYEWQKAQGLGEATNAATASGGAIGGNALTALNNYAQNYAGSAYQQALQNYYTGNSNIFGYLSGTANMGANAAVGAGSNASNFATGMGNTIVGAGNAKAAGDIGVANAFGGAGSNFGNMYMLNNLTGGKLFGGGGGGGGGATPNAYGGFNGLATNDQYIGGGLIG